MNFTYGFNGLTMQNLINSNYPQIIEKLFKQISTSISNLLQYINSLYQTHGINFSVIPFHAYLMRILTPFQLLSKLGITDVSHMLIKNTQNKSHNRLFNTSFNHEDSNLQKNTRNNLSKSHPHMGAVRTNQRQQKFGFGNRPFLEREQQEQVIRFMEDKYQKGIAITLQMISDYARQLGNNKYFIASSGWAKNFLKRHPEMKELYHQSREQKKESSSFQHEDTLHKQPKYSSNYNQNYSQLAQNRTSMNNRNQSQQNSRVSAFQDWNLYADYYSKIKVQANQKRNGNDIQNGQLNGQKTEGKFIYNNNSLFQSRNLQNSQQEEIQPTNRIKTKKNQSQQGTKKKQDAQQNIEKHEQKIEDQNSRIPSKSFKVQNMSNISNY